MTLAGVSRRLHPTLVRVLLTLALVLPLAAARAGVSVCGPSVLDSVAGATSRPWQPPLDRVVSLHGRDMALREALDHLAAAARVRLSYASELLPLDQRVCGEFEGVVLGDALVSLLSGTTLEPVIAGASQVVLAPSLRQRNVAVSASVRSLAPKVLERVVVTGSTIGAPERSLPVALDVVSGRQVAEHGSSAFSSMLDGSVPGLWMWQQSPSSLLSRYASIRGASSFAVNYPKIYVDGIEVANPLLVTRFFPDAIERIEVIRGPQGAALYGADAISGVINVITRHEGTGPDGKSAQFQTSAGMSESDYVTGGAFVQTQTITYRSGSNTRSAGLGLSLGSAGSYVPNGASRHLTGSGETRLIGPRSTLSLTGRVFGERSGPALSPVLSPWISYRGELPHGAPGHPGEDGYRTLAVAPTEEQSVNQFTLGSTATYFPNGTWTHTAVAGVDGYDLSNVVVDGGPIPSAADSALRAASGNAVRGTFRVSSVAQIGEDQRASARFTFAAEQTVLREATAATLDHGGFGGPSRTASVSWRNNTGLIAQGNFAVGNALFITSGARVERNAGYTRQSNVSLLPMLGAAFVKDVGRATFKVRTAYGKGIRPPQTSLHQEGWRSYQQSVMSPTLSPEVQSGIEGGFDVFYGRLLSLHVTRFDQLASGLIQSVAVVDSQSSGPQGGLRRVYYQLQNVGEISNRGWELQSAVQAGPLSLGGALSFVQSTVRRVIDGYTGDLRPGDRMLEVPARTASVSATWLSAPWLVSVGVSRAYDWINYDRVQLTQDLAAAGRTPGEFIGPQLRAYWRRYPGAARVRGSVGRDLPRGLAVTLAGENLLGYQRGEPDNATVIPGRTINFGLRVKF